MKKKLLFPLLSLVAFAPLTVGVVSQHAATETWAAASGYTNSTLTKTINLNPVSETEIRSYYKDLDGKSLQGNELLKALKPILKNGQQYHSYDSGNSVWQAYEITDRDWELSPASGTLYGKYDAATNTITNYEYGSNSSPKNNPYQHMFYRNRGVAAGYWKAWDHHGDNKGTDREHIWAKSRGFGKDNGVEVKVPGARGDLHHLVAADSYVNSSTHSNNSYGFVNMSTVTDDAGSKYTIGGTKIVDGNYRGKPLNIAGDGSTEVFEPQDCDKGDIARACFYMVARYNNLARNDDTIDAGNPNLFLNDEISVETVYSTADKPVSIGILKDLLAWHKLDPVDEYEIHRNDLIYRNYDHNRNPFIDFPEWVDAVWGTVELESDNRTTKSRDASPKGMAAPATDKIYNQGSGGGSSSSASSQSSSSAPATSESTPAASSSSSSEGGNQGSMNPLVLGLIIAGVAIVVIVIIIIAVHGHGKAKKAARKVLKKGAKSIAKSSSKSSSSNKKRK
ncbi:MAG: endonuclease [Bacilli bacterium]|nr:endonuclease [Bacilli bacterium]